MPCCFSPYAASRPKKSSANHYSIFPGLAVIQHAVDIINITEAQYTFKSLPGIGGTNGFGTSRQNQAIITDHFALFGIYVFTGRSMRTAGSPANRRMPLSAYRACGCSMMSSIVFSPESTGDSIIRL